MPFVLDASVTACWAFRDEDHPHADLALERARTDEALVPCLWYFEVRNILVVNERRARLTELETAGFFRDLSQLRVKMDHTPDDGQILRRARAYRLSIYDAAYLELARREHLPLATLDAALADAARAEGVHVLGDPESRRP